MKNGDVNDEPMLGYLSDPTMSEGPLACVASHGPAPCALRLQATNMLIIIDHICTAGYTEGTEGGSQVQRHVIVF